MRGEIAHKAAHICDLGKGVSIVSLCKGGERELRPPCSALHCKTGKGRAGRAQGQGNGERRREAKKTALGTMRGEEGDERGKEDSKLGHFTGSGQLRQGRCGTRVRVHGVSAVRTSSG